MGSDELLQVESKHSPWVISADDLDEKKGLIGPFFCAFLRMEGPFAEADLTTDKRILTV